FLLTLLLVQPVPSSPPPTERNTRRRIKIDETDGVLLPGLSDSLVSYLKTLAANRIGDFHKLEHHEKFRVLACMNNVLDLEGIAANGSNCSLNTDQQATIAHFLAEIHDEENNIFEREASLSEGDYIIKIWGYVVEKLFYKTKTCLPEILVTEQKTSSHRMDLHMLCKSNLSKHDLCDGEFGKAAVPGKLYHDKAKLLMNGKNQLNYLLSKNPGDPSEVKITLFQVLGFEADLYHLLEYKLAVGHNIVYFYNETSIDYGVYLPKKIKNFAIPTIARKFAKDMKNFMEGMSILRHHVLEFVEICNDNSKRTDRLSEITKPSCTVDHSAKMRSVWAPPPSP
ncbi:hypothetical protein INT47_011055, partial [Mucor saturninus]